MKRIVTFASISLGAILVVLTANSPVFRVSAVLSGENGPPQRLENFDARPSAAQQHDDRVSTTETGAKALVKSARVAADGFAERMPGTQFEFADATGLVETVSAGPRTRLALGSSTGSRAQTLRSFVNDNPELFARPGASTLETSFDYANPDGVLGFTGLTQHVDGVPVFQGEARGMFNKASELVRVINYLAPAASDGIEGDFGSPEPALANAMVHVGVDPGGSVPNVISRKAVGSVVFERGPFTDETTAEKVYFPIRPGTLLPAWKFLVWTDSAAYYVIVDARTGGLLWRKCITEEQSLPATFNVYGSNAGLMYTADSPSPFTPGCLTPLACAQPPLIPRTNFTLVGNESPNQFNNLGWIPDTGLPVRTPADPNITDGNNAEVGIDRDGIQGVDANGWATGTPFRVFSYNYNPAPGDPAPGEEPVPPGPQPYPPTPYQQGIITHAFYTVNRFHDAAYRLGFTEQAGNFQHFNFGRGGVEGDRVSFEVQDSSGTNGTSNSTPADGGRSRMQIFRWTGPTPDRDGSLDSQIVVHELTHGVTARMHGNATGLNSNMARGMGEGWSDFFALAML